LSWESVVPGLREALDARHQAREEALRLCRTIIQSKAIRLVHRRDVAAAESGFAECVSQTVAARTALSAHPELYHAGYLQDAEKEMVEAAIVLAMALGRPFPTPTELGVGPVAYLHGAGEAASEMRRYLLDELRAGRLAEAERLLGEMEAVYDDLSSFDYPDGLTGGLRRTNDALRAVIERTRSDVTLTHVQRELLDELRRGR
jgi:translin